MRLTKISGEGNESDVNSEHLVLLDMKILIRYYMK